MSAPYFVQKSIFTIKNYFTLNKQNIRYHGFNVISKSQTKQQIIKKSFKFGCAGCFVFELLLSDFVNNFDLECCYSSVNIVGTDISESVRVGINKTSCLQKNNEKTRKIIRILFFPQTLVGGGLSLQVELKWGLTVVSSGSHDFCSSRDCLWGQKHYRI